MHDNNNSKEKGNTGDYDVTMAAMLAMMRGNESARKF